MATLALYNNDTALWLNARPSYQRDGIRLKVIEGHIWNDRDGFIGRFEDDQTAIDHLLRAGYIRGVGRNVFMP